MIDIITLYIKSDFSDTLPGVARDEACGGPRLTAGKEAYLMCKKR